MTTNVPTILLIDDDTDDQEMFLSALEFIDESIVCNTAPNGYEAIMQLNDADSLPDLIFLDLNMPVMNGVQFLREVKVAHKAKDVPVVIYSTASDNQTIQEAKQLGAFQFITKPEKFSELVGLLHGLLYPATR
ncbi:response regulator [Chitinophaga barathri]|uniref:Response regulator n=1 Tax=Chitinophaga barathri TaxID=1647451 RepID=A0A3N4MG39_9BACT|nr:response regulator [Chitinophaga barathri]RPD38619.1 response regulator [Chitinophaga barathri]